MPQIIILKPVIVKNKSLGGGEIQESKHPQEETSELLMFKTVFLSCSKWRDAG